MTQVITPEPHAALYLELLSGPNLLFCLHFVLVDFTILFTLFFEQLLLRVEL